MHCRAAFVGRHRGVLLASALWLSACSADTPDSGTERTCVMDIECGAQQYCTEAQLCRTDCFTDTDCLGPTTTAQCNTHGRCIDSVDPDAGPSSDAGGDGSSDGVNESTGDETGDESGGDETDPSPVPIDAGG